MDTVRAAQQQVKLRHRYELAHQRTVDAHGRLTAAQARDKAQRRYKPSRATLEARKLYEHMRERRARSWHMYRNWMDRALPCLIRFVQSAGIDLASGAVIQLQDDGEVHVYYGGHGLPNGRGHGHVQVMPSGELGYHRPPMVADIHREAVELVS